MEFKFWLLYQVRKTTAVFISCVVNLNLEKPGDGLENTLRMQKDTTVTSQFDKELSTTLRLFMFVFSFCMHFSLYPGLVFQECLKNEHHTYFSYCQKKRSILLQFNSGFVVMDLILWRRAGLWTSKWRETCKMTVRSVSWLGWWLAAVTHIHTRPHVWLQWPRDASVTKNTRRRKELIITQAWEEGRALLPR